MLEAAFIALVWLFVKHFICDFPLQATPWMYRNKGTYGHVGGLAHSALHGLGTFVILIYWLGLHAWVYALTDAVIHYHIDWAKMNTNRYFNLKPDNSEWFWISLGFDQLLHHLTYFGIVAIAFKLI
ncbi:MAG TPA: DUF3307 domain-containing protein [Methylophilaceae bacterium]|nr:DUF3307 domain-containing protein [Methylophilaceae bacterium]